jgi:hypothetical protein
MWSSLPGVMAQSYSPYLGPPRVSKRFWVQTHWCAGESHVNPLPLRLTWVANGLSVGSCLLLCFHPNLSLFGKVSVSYGSSPLERSLPSIGRGKKLFHIWKASKSPKYMKRHNHAKSHCSWTIPNLLLTIHTWFNTFDENIQQLTPVKVSGWEQELLDNI